MPLSADLQVVLGIDQSLRHTGLFTITEAGFAFSQVDSGSRRGAERLLYIRDEVQRTVDTYKPTLVALEGYAYGAPGRLAELGEVAGALKVLVQERSIPLITATPMQVKKFSTGKHNADKIDVVRAVNSRFNLSWTEKENNMADAAALAMIAEAYLDPSRLTKRHQLEVIAKLRGEVNIKRKKSSLPRNRFPKI